MNRRRQRSSDGPSAPAREVIRPVKAEVEILADVPAAYAQGIYAKPGGHGALIRLSNTAGHLGTDAQLVARATCITIRSEETSTLGGHYDC